MQTYLESKRFEEEHDGFAISELEREVDSLHTIARQVLADKRNQSKQQQQQHAHTFYLPTLVGDARPVRIAS